MHDLAQALRDVEPFLRAAHSARGDGYVNHEGGDVGGHGTERALHRHVANYLAAAELGERAGLHGRIVDVGSGTGALGAWLADRLDAELHLVDRDASIRRVALAAFPGVRVHAELDEVPSASAALVTAMEVIEHIAYDQQPAFARALFARVAPGGLLVLSTPDESRYAGGWSGYAPHVGPLTARALHDLLAAATGGGVRVWRVEGDVFHLGGVRRVVQPIANRAWARLSPLLGPLSERVAGPAAALATLASRHARPHAPPQVRTVAPSAGAGTGLIGVVRAST